ncbi:hypothetical protein ACS8E9_09525 [Pseudomonas neustonica]|uniref:hypothetical protein n=1 Tax=Pseudomonas neustonica TaxID=2487346 RepID=UPI003F45DA5D
MSKTFCSEYRGVDYDLLCKDWPKGWMLEMQVRKEGVPRRSYDDKLFDSYDAAREHGVAEAQKLIDDLLRNEAP